ncbi:hypothetical protein R1sor_009677 [Riccia sorocarpa]|uniref:Uncharacterized protein n=1 Tax=Riccia sorocarpa TaxID=122646 RepID=A0ABD3HXL3_9MARC
MSADVLAGFLPWTVEYLKSNEGAKRILDHIFPPEIQEICPAPFHQFSIGGNLLSVRWPLVAVFCIIGFVSGITMGSKLLYTQRRGSQQVSGYFMWGSTFIWYGLMCLGGLFTHSIQTSHAHVFYLLDVIATGCSGMSSVGGFLSAWELIDDRRMIWKVLATSVYAILCFLAVNTTPMQRDMVYVLPSLACILFLVNHRMTFGRKERSGKLTAADDPRVRGAEKGLDIGVLGTCLAIVSVAADRYLCQILGSHGGFLVWVFIGCDISLFGAYKFITELRSLSPTSAFKLKDV